ncbi:MAG: RHS repeat protein [Halobacteriovoraceae bacterium]|nr:RHS repeat protein [Halobacteriovoraceae bacterium]
MTLKTFFKIALLSAFTLCSSYGGVNYKNGNYYVSYTDLVVPGGSKTLDVTRTYNSKSIENGSFGVGWGIPYDTFLTVGADGAVTIHENGAGALTRFTPKKTVDADAAVDKIIKAMRKKSQLTGTAEDTLRKKLRNDADLRQAYAKEFGVTSNLAAGTKLYSNERGLQIVEKVKDGYERTYSDGKVESFNEKGNLAEVKTKNGYWIKLNYSKTGKLESVKDSLAKQIFFSWFPNGKIECVWGVGKKKSCYKYEGKKLVESEDVAGNVYKYMYDNNYNMTQISYKDGSKYQIEYWPNTQFVKKITEKNGDWTEYKYDSNPKNPDFHYWTTVTNKRGSAQPVSNKYEYEIKVKPDGSQYTYRIATDVNGITTETVYSECCGQPLKITRGKQVTTFEYNDKGLLTKKTSTRGEYVQLEYHPTFNKITKVVNNKGTTDFQYDKKGNLSKATNDKGKSVLLVYDRKGRIQKMVDYNKGKSDKAENKRTLTFKYDANGKPVEIAMDNVGKINVRYDNFGEIKKVESKAGHKMALQVTQAFQSLLTIVKPAGVNLNL